MGNKREINGENCNGAVVCFQKFPIGQNVKYREEIIPANSEKCIPNSPACLGYFNRVDVKLIRDFRQYVGVTSEHEADYPCSRKQLLLQRIKRCKHLEEIQLKDSEDAGNGLPFESIDGAKFALCCFSVFNVSFGGRQSKNPHYVSKDQVNNEKLAERLYTVIKKKGIAHDYRIVFMQLLGTEDLCLIILSNHCKAISDVIAQLQDFNHDENSSEKKRPDYRVDNVHSILMIDRGDHNEANQIDWGSTTAEMLFSLHSSSGMVYLREQEEKLNKYLEKHYQKQTESGLRTAADTYVMVESCSGEYDAILRCPSWLLPIVLGMPVKDSVQGCFHPDNKEYKDKVYQSDTYIHPFGLNAEPNEERTTQEQHESRRNNASSLDTEGLLSFVMRAMERLRDLFNIDAENNDYEFLKLPIWRMLKEYWSFASFPMDEDLRDDLEYQFKVAINAIVREAELSKLAADSTGNKQRFMEKYDEIVRALDASMQAGSQQDRWYFGEQQSYIVNVDSYYKILHCYYGMLKDLITLIYEIPRSEGTVQPYLVPVLSFGVNPLITSNAYDSFINKDIDTSMKVGERKPAKLVCIRLPYQALSNPLKYLGILAHEIFHYAAPADRENRNELMLYGLIRVAMSEFINILGQNADRTDDKDVFLLMYEEDKAFKEVFDKVARKVYESIPRTSDIRLKNIRKVVEKGHLRFTVDPTSKEGFNCYFRVWLNLRHIFWNALKAPAEEKNKDVSELPPFHNQFLLRYHAMFALDDGSWPNPRDVDYLNKMKELYLTRIRETSHSQTDAIRKLLKNTYLAMKECPPDIFDLEVVMSGKSPEDKIRQFFWQQYSAKRDVMFSDSIADVEEGKPLLLKNNIRSAMIVNCYMQQRQNTVDPDKKKDAPEELRAVLEEWGRSDFKPAFAEARSEFLTIYERVYHRFCFLFEQNSMICKQIADRINGLKENDGSKSKDILESLTKYYERYYQALSDYQKGGGCEDRASQRYDRVFDATCDLINQYQPQDSFTISGRTSGKLQNTANTYEPEQKTWSRVSFDCDEMAYTSADLLYKLSLAYERMMVNGKMPMLWYRGQMNIDWKTLPNVMRMKCVESDDLDSEGFSKLQAYQVQLAQAHILPEGEHLSKAEWLAFLQHYGFISNTLDFSESLSPALFFATEEWSDKEKRMPAHDAVVMLFNPVLFNLVMELFERESQFNQVKAALKLIEKLSSEADGSSGVTYTKSAFKEYEEAKKALFKAFEGGESVKMLEVKSNQYMLSYGVLMQLRSVDETQARAVLIEEQERLEKSIEDAEKNLKEYLSTGISYEHPPLFTAATEQEDKTYRYLYDFKETSCNKSLHPRAVLVPRHCDRMDKQSGEFVYYNLNAHKTADVLLGDKGKVEMKCAYNAWSLEQLHQKYIEYCKKNLSLCGHSENAKFTPFLCRIKLNHFRYRGFKRYVHAMGMHNYSVYPEYDKLADDLKDQLDLK